MTRPVGDADALVAQLRTALDRVSRRAGAVASNVANVDTPGYRAVDVNFPDLLRVADGLDVVRTRARHLGPSSATPDAGVVVEVPSDRIRNDGNNVDIDREMTLMAQLQGRYSQATELVRARLALLVYAATDGRSQS